MNIVFIQQINIILKYNVMIPIKKKLFYYINNYTMIINNINK